MLSLHKKVVNNKELDDSQLAKLKTSIPVICYCHEIYRVEAVGLKYSHYTLKNTIFVNM